MLNQHPNNRNQYPNQYQKFPNNSISDKGGTGNGVKRPFPSKSTDGGMVMNGYDMPMLGANSGISKKSEDVPKAPWKTESEPAAKRVVLSKNEYPNIQPLSHDLIEGFMSSEMPEINAPIPIKYCYQSASAPSHHRNSTGDEPKWIDSTISTVALVSAQKGCAPSPMFADAFKVVDRSHHLQTVDSAIDITNAFLGKGDYRINPSTRIPPLYSVPPAYMPTQSNGHLQILSAPGKNNNPNNDKVCSNCGATKAPTWRRSIDGKRILCNACGLFNRLHKCDRPFVVNSHGGISIKRGGSAGAGTQSETISVIANAPPLHYPTSNGIRPSPSMVYDNSAYVNTDSPSAGRHKYYPQSNAHQVITNDIMKVLGSLQQ